MKITVERTGGFTGLTERVASLETDKLSESEGKQIAEKVRATKFFQLPEHLPEGEVGADLYSYRVTVIDGARSHSVTFRGERDAAGLHDLIQAVSR